MLAAGVWQRGTPGRCRAIKAQNRNSFFAVERGASRAASSAVMKREKRIQASG